MSSLFFLLQFSAKHEEEEENDNTFKHVIIIYCFCVAQLHEEDDDLGTFLTPSFFCVATMCIT